MQKKDLSESDIKAKYITPAIINSGWDELTQINREVYFTDGMIHVNGKSTIRGKRKFADYILYYKPNIPVAIIEAKSNKKSLKSGIQQALDYANILDIPFVFSSNGDGFYFHDKSNINGNLESELSLKDFPSPSLIWNKYKQYKDINNKEEEGIISQDYFSDTLGRKPRYYQQIAINRTIEAIAKKNNRILIVMATGTGKTYTAFQIIYRLWKSGTKNRILFLTDRTSLIDQTARGDFKNFKEAMTIVKNKEIDPAYNIYLSLYQGLSDSKENDAYKNFSRNFFDLVIIDECHRGSVKQESKWREILKYFKKATHIGLTATPKETNEVSNQDYFGLPIYTYTLKQGINDGFLAPYKVIKITLDIDINGWKPPQGFKDKKDKPVKDKTYTRSDFDKNIIVEERRKLVAKKITEFLKGHGRYSKTIVFCVDIEHAEGMRTALINENSDIANENNKYVMQITGDNDIGKRELDNFINPSEVFPVIATTSKLMTTGIDAQTCQLIVLDSNISSPTEFKQIIGRGTRINEEYNKTYFTIMDFRNTTNLFSDPDFDGDPINVIDVHENENLINIENNEFNNNLDTEDEINTQTKKQSKDKNKTHVEGISVNVNNESIEYFDNNGKVIQIDIKKYAKINIKQEYAIYDDFINAWNNTDKKKSIIENLEQKGVLFDSLQQEIGYEFDYYDIICYIGYNKVLLTREERVKNLKNRADFDNYNDKTKVIIEELLNKYVTGGVLTLENIETLKLQPINNYGSLLEIIYIFGGKNSYLKVIENIIKELYKV